MSPRHHALDRLLQRQISGNVSQPRGATKRIAEDFNTHPREENIIIHLFDVVFFSRYVLHTSAFYDMCCIALRLYACTVGTHCTACNACLSPFVRQPHKKREYVTQQRAICFLHLHFPTPHSSPLHFSTKQTRRWKLTKKRLIL